MYIVPAGFPGRLKRLPLFSANARLSFSPLVTSLLNLARWLALNPDQFLDDLFNRLKLCVVSIHRQGELKRGTGPLIAGS
jgi:hypothetical protein